MTEQSVPRTAQALKARRERSQQKLQHVGEALGRMLKTRTSITVAAVAREAGVSRTFLYEHAEAADLVEKAILKASGRRAQDRHAAQTAIDAAWRERALNAEEALKAAQTEILAQRRQMGELLGQVRDLSTPWQERDVVRIMTEHAALTRKVQELNGEKRSLEDRLNASRDNARFADRRIAELEAELIETKGMVRQR
ncbi:DUF6262 family protein [Streptomyces boluensis]|uniref:Uncharacterized protein n=1 Tax=Streptomyces boluensis TaxID=1775135 RepID=A0A964UMK0_9ACTN|nr:DUF6262 family protein [Streptomyces boluensis]NBE51993.1 hypothetical protein [Streptomyces boluensis]